MNELNQYIRNIPNFPKPGIQFKDITPLIKEPRILKMSVKKLIEPFIDQKLTAVAGLPTYSLELVGDRPAGLNYLKSKTNSLYWRS